MKFRTSLTSTTSWTSLRTVEIRISTSPSPGLPSRTSWISETGPISPSIRCPVNTPITPLRYSGRNRTRHCSLAIITSSITSLSTPSNARRIRPSSSHSRRPILLNYLHSTRQFPRSLGTRLSLILPSPSRISPGKSLPSGGRRPCHLSNGNAWLWWAIWVMQRPCRPTDQLKHPKTSHQLIHPLPAMPSRRRRLFTHSNRRNIVSCRTRSVSTRDLSKGWFIRVTGCRIRLRTCWVLSIVQSMRQSWRSMPSRSRLSMCRSRNRGICKPNWHEWWGNWRRSMNSWSIQ